MTNPFIVEIKHKRQLERLPPGQLVSKLGKIGLYVGEEDCGFQPALGSHICPTVIYPINNGVINREAIFYFRRDPKKGEVLFISQCSNLSRVNETDERYKHYRDLLKANFLTLS